MSEFRLPEGAFVHQSPLCKEFSPDDYACLRPEGHGGRHAWIGVHDEGRVHAVWGEDVHAEMRAQARGEALARKLHADGTLARLSPRRTIHLGGAQ